MGESVVLSVTAALLVPVLMIPVLGLKVEKTTGRVSGFSTLEAGEVGFLLVVVEVGKLVLKLIFFLFVVDTNVVINNERVVFAETDTEEDVPEAPETWTDPFSVGIIDDVPPEEGKIGTSAVVVPLLLDVTGDDMFNIPTVLFENTELKGLTVDAVDDSALCETFLEEFEATVGVNHDRVDDLTVPKDADVEVGNAADDLGLVDKTDSLAVVCSGIALVV